MAINPVTSQKPIASPAAAEIQQRPPTAGEKPFSRSGVSSHDPRQPVQVHPRYIGGANLYDAPRSPTKTSSSSPHIHGDPVAGNPRGNLEPNGNPTHLVGFHSNGKPVVLQKVPREAPAGEQPKAVAADESRKPKRAESPSPHVVGADGPAGK